MSFSSRNYCPSSYTYCILLRPTLIIVNNIHIPPKTSRNYFAITLHYFATLRSTLWNFVSTLTPFHNLWFTMVIFSTTLQPSSDLCYTIRDHNSGFCLGFRVEYHQREGTPAVACQSRTLIYRAAVVPQDSPRDQVSIHRHTWWVSRGIKVPYAYPVAEGSFN